MIFIYVFLIVVKIQRCSILHFDYLLELFFSPKWSIRNRIIKENECINSQTLWLLDLNISRENTDVERWQDHLFMIMRSNYKLLMSIQPSQVRDFVPFLGLAKFATDQLSCKYAKTCKVEYKHSWRNLVDCLYIQAGTEITGQSITEICKQLSLKN